MKNSNGLPEDFDWVTARHGCSLQIVFHHLEEDAKANVETRNAQLGMSRFDVLRDGAAKFYVRRESKALRTFLLSETAITVEDQHRAAMLQATVGISDGADCRLKIDGAELQRWQFLKRALDDVLFSD